MKEYKYDIAISLCKQDVEYSRSLVKELNPKLDVFFYEDNQREIVGQLGFEKFGDVFKHEARVVVILYRIEWGESTYTELERAAIQDRMNDANQGQSFLMLIAMDSHKVPGWYPSSRIYADPFKFPANQMAEFIEYKVNESGGNVEPLTFEEIVENAQQKRKDRISLVQFLQSTESRNNALEELQSLVAVISEKMNSIQSKDLGVRIGMRDFHSEPWKTFQNAEGYLLLGNLRIKVTIKMSQLRPDRYSSQSIGLLVKYEELEDQQYAFETGRDMGRYNVLNEVEYRFNSDRNKLKGWSLLKTIDESDRDSNTGVYFGYDKPYDLKKIIPTKELADQIFKKIFEIFEVKHPVNY